MRFLTVKNFDKDKSTKFMDSKNNLIVDVNGLVKRFPIGFSGFFTALKGIDLTVSEGEFMGLVGPSGSGKTTFLNIIGTLDKPSEGRVNVLDRNAGTLLPGKLHS